MPKLPHLSGTEVGKVLTKLGFTFIRQSGSHMIFRKDRVGCVVPNHREIKQGTLMGILRQAGVSAEEFIQACP